MLKKSFEEMSKKEFITVKTTSSLIAGCLFSATKYLWDRLSNRLGPFGFYIFAFLLFSVGWYFLFFLLLCKKRNIKK